MKRKIFTLFIILMFVFSSLSVFAMEDDELVVEEQIVSASMSYSSVKTKRDVKLLSSDILDDYSAVFRLAKTYTGEFKDFRGELNEFIEESQEDYQKRREENLEQIQIINKRIKSNTKKHNKAVENSDEKNMDYYQSLISADNNEIDEIMQIMDDDYDVFVTIKTEVMNQLNDAKKINRTIKKNRESSKKVKKRFSRLSNSYLGIGRANKKSSLKKVVNTANTLNQKLLMLETKCRKQLQYFEEYEESIDD